MTRLPRRLAAIACAVFAAAGARSATAAEPRGASGVQEDPPLFEVAMGEKGPLAGDAENLFLLPCGGGPSSIEVDADGRWWVLDAIASRLVVFERDGRVARTIIFPPTEEKKPKKKKGAGADSAAGKSASPPPFRADLVLDGAGGVFVLNATEKRVERYDAEGKLTASFGGEKVSRPKAKQALLEIPQRISMLGGELFVIDNGSETMLRFAGDGEFLGAIPATDAAPAPGGTVFLLSAGETDETWLETWPEVGALGIPGKKRIARVKASPGKVLHDAQLLGGTLAAEAVVAAIEGTDDEAERVRVLRIDRGGTAIAERVLPFPKDDGSPVRRWRLTRDGKIAWFRIQNGKFQAFELSLPGRVTPRQP